MNTTVRAAGGGDRFRQKGQAAAYTLGEAASTEWLIAALPLLTNAGPSCRRSTRAGRRARTCKHRCTRGCGRAGSWGPGTR
ncbi:hypothetical protein SMICM304S_12146 [Streptomyces microflavus]